MNGKPLFPLRTILRLSFRYTQRHFWQSILMILAISLGVAVMIGVDIANLSASQSFALSTTAITGRATHYLSAGSSGVPEEVYLKLRRDGFEYPAAPALSFFLSSPQLGDVTLQAIGIDPFAERPFRDFLFGGGLTPQGNLGSLITTPNTVVLSNSLVDYYQLGLGSEIEILVGGRTREVTVVGIVVPNTRLNREALNDLVVMDIATAQEITGKIGYIDRVELILPEDQPGLINTIQNKLPGQVLIQPIESRTGIVRELTNAFQINLTALSLLAMVVALFLIYNTMTYSVIQRRPFFGILRSLGMTRQEIFMMVMVESFIMGISGAILGTILGILLAKGSVGLVTQTINDLFFVTAVRDLPLPLSSILKGILVGIAATMITAAFPAWEAVRIPPISSVTKSNLETKINYDLPRITLFSVICLLIGSGILLIPTNNLVVSFGATFLIILGIALLTPRVVISSMNWMGKFTELIWGALGRIAPRDVINSLSRTAIAIAALMVAVAVTIGVSIMINSFRVTVELWLDQILQGDIYLSVAGTSVSQPVYGLDPDILDRLNEQKGINKIYTLQTALVESPNGPIQVAANNNPNDGQEQIYLFNQVPPSQIWGELEEGSVLISEPLMNRLNLPSQGGKLELYTDRGLESFPIVGVFYDYSSSQGSALFAQNTYQNYWSDETVTAISLLLDPGVDVNAMTQQLKIALSGRQKLLIRANQTLRNETLEIFDRTFAITATLQLMTTIVAFIGVLSAIMTLQIDKKRQVGILRALGLTARQLWTLVLVETGLMGAVAGFLALPTGYILSLILIYIINRRSFGWTLQMQLEAGPFLEAFLLAITASLLAGIIPAQQVLKQNTSEAIRFE